MTKDKNLVPTTSINRGELKICLVEMEPGWVSVGIVNGDHAKFPFDWDRQDAETAARIGADIVKGLHGTPEQILRKPGYSMDYPIKYK